MTVESSANVVRLRFRSDFAISGSGFRIDWTAFKTVTGCPGKMITQPHGTISLPGDLPQQDRLRMELEPPYECIYTIIAPGRIINCCELGFMKQ